MSSSPPICTPGYASGCAQRFKKKANTSLNQCPKDKDIIIPKIEKTDTPNSLDQYRKDKDGKYWFEMIPETDKESWRRMIRDSIMEFFNTMIMTGQISDEINIEYNEYIAAVNKFLG